MAKAKTITRGKGRIVAASKPSIPFVQIIDKADDLGRGIKALENAAEGAFIDSAGTTAINWMLEHLEREFSELRAMLKEAHVANGGAHV
jgi:hypothetical protein